MDISYFVALLQSNVVDLRFFKSHQWFAFLSQSHTPFSEATAFPLDIAIQLPISNKELPYFFVAYLLEGDPQLRMLLRFFAKTPPTSSSVCSGPTVAVNTDQNRNVMYISVAHLVEGNSFMQDFPLRKCFPWTHIVIIQKCE